MNTNISDNKTPVSAPPQRDTQDVLDGPRLFDQCVIRIARKNHRCDGGYDQEKRKRKVCDRLIVKGERYIEYFGESAAYQSGHRHHFQCAEEQGLILPRVSESATKLRQHFPRKQINPKPRKNTHENTTDKLDAGTNLSLL